MQNKLYLTQIWQKVSKILLYITLNSALYKGKVEKSVLGATFILVLCTTQS